MAHIPTRPFGHDCCSAVAAGRGARSGADLRARKAYQVSRVSRPRCAPATATRLCQRRARAICGCSVHRGRASSAGAAARRPGHAGAHTPPARPPRLQWLAALACGVATGALAFALNWATEALVWVKVQAMSSVLAPGGK